MWWLEREAGTGYCRTLLCTLFPDKGPLAQMRIDRRELPSQTGISGKPQIRLKIPLRVRDSDTVGGVTTHTDQFEQLCWGKCWFYLLLNKTTCLALRQEEGWSWYEEQRAWRRRKSCSKVTFYHRDGRLKRTFLLLLMAKGCCNPGKSLRNGSGRSAAIPEADTHLSEMLCSDC